MNFILDGLWSFRRGAGQVASLLWAYRGVARTLLLLCAIVTFGSLWEAQPALAQSSGCSAINATWGGGVTLTNEEDLWNQGPIAGLSVLAGEKITYVVRTSGTSIANAGFAIYKNNGENSPSDVLLEEYASLGNELNLNATHVVSADNDGYVIYAWSYGGGTVEATVTCAAAAAAPSITAHPANTTVAAGGNASFSATASDATSYQWQVDTGSGFANITNGGVYSGATTTSLTITGALASMNSYQYRLVATGSTSPEATTNTARLTVVGAPSISGISPSLGVVTGGTSVTLSGTNLSGATAVTFGGAPASSFTVVTDTTITAVTPVHTAGAADVVVTTNGGSATLVGGYTYFAISTDATLSDLAPGSGTLTPAFASGTTSYTASVANSVNSITVTPTVNESNATIAVNGSPATSGSASSIPLSVGNNTITVVVTAQDGTTAKTYTLAVTRAVAAPTLTSTSPSSGPVAGGTSVSIAGTSLTGATAVSFGGLAASSFTVNGDTSITATAPVHVAGAVDVVVVAPGGTATLTNGYTYVVPSIALSPSDGALAAGTLGLAYSQTVTASGGTAPYNYAVTSGALPAGLTLNAATGVISGTPTASGNFSFTVAATDANALTNSASYSIATAVQAPGAGPVSATVAGNSSANPITLSLSGGTASSVAVASAASHGTATASGTSITYTPSAGYSGADSFTYTATNATGTSAAATVTITVTAPALSLTPPAGSLTGGAVGTAYSQTIAVSGGTAPYSYAVTSSSLPAGLLLNASTGAITGTPTVSGNSTFTVRATDFYGATASASYSIAVLPSAVAFTFSPSGGALTEAMADENYDQQITAEGGTGALIYSVASGTLPQGMVLNISTGALTGPLSADTEGDYSFTIEVRDGSGSTGTANFTLKVNPRAVAVTDKVVDVPAGSTPNNVYLNAGATGGPFTSAESTFVEPTNAGTATIIRGQLAQVGPVVTPIGWYLQFTPNPAYSGQVRVGFRLTSALGASNTGMVTYNLGYNAAEVAHDIDARVRGFVQSRQSMISSTIAVPGLLERRRMKMTTDPVAAYVSPSKGGLALGFATSLAQMAAARENPDGVGGAASSPFNIWIDGAFLAHNRGENGGKWGSFGMVSLGADYLLSEKVLLGLSIHYDRMVDPTDEDAKLTGNGWLAGPYASFEIGKNVFWDTSLLYGGSSNDISTQFWDGTFDTRRWLFDSSLKGQWQLDDTTVLTPRLRAVYFSEKVEDYAVRNEGGDLIEIEGFAQEQLRLSLGAEIARSFVLADGSALTPRLGVTAGFSGLDGSGLFGSVSTGLSWQTANDWMLDAGLLFNIEGEGEKSVGAKLGVSTGF